MGMRRDLTHGSSPQNGYATIMVTKVQENVLFLNSVLTHLVEHARNLTSQDNIPLTIGHYLNHMGKLTDQFFESKDNYKDKNKQRIYLKDIDCPPVWQDKLRDMLPSGLFYWNDSTGDFGGPGSTNEGTLHGASKRKGKGIAPAGDLMSSLPQEMRAENLMCYVGHEGTYTAAHREMCASLGQNIMVHTSNDVDESGNPQKPGSSIWFMTESKHRQVVSEYWLSTLGHDIELENHYAQISAWQRAPFKVYVVEQKLGDFILIPPLAPHQVWNRGTCTVKVAWNRTTVQTLEHAIHEALPKARMVCRDEQYKNKATIYYTLMKYSGLLRKAQQIASRNPQDEQFIYAARKIRQLHKDFKTLFNLFKEILLSEMFSQTLSKEYPEYVAFDSNVTCSYCRCNIFNRFITCKSCPDQFGGDDPYDICMDCFVMGRSCRCQSKFKWVEQFRWKDLCERYEDWRRQYIDLDQGMTGITPCTLTDERRLHPKKTTAQICQEQLRIRPWRDVKNDAPAEDENEDAEDEVRITADGTVRKIVKKKSQVWLNNNLPCHTCIKRHPKWTMAECKCGKAWCYGSLFRAHDLMPQDVMEDPNWECPHCRLVCSTGACRKDRNQHPYEPKGTLLGHDTKKVADVRSIESLVDFGVSNLSWIREGVGTPLERRLVEAEQDGDGADADGYMDIDEQEDQYHQRIYYSPIRDAIDPALGGGAFNGPSVEQPSILSLNEDEDIAGPSHPALLTSSQYPELNELGAPQGYVDPSAISHQPPPAYKAENGFTAVNDTPKGKKRRLDDIDPIKLVQPKKCKNQPEDATPSKNKASKQFQHEQNKKLLEQAGRDGRYLVVWAAINKRKLMITLHLQPETLRSFKTLETANNTRQTRPAIEANVLLRSDIAPQIPTHSLSRPAQTPKAKPYKARVERDDDFRSRKRDKKHQQAKYEEIMADDEEEDEDQEQPRPPQTATRDRSAWVSRKHGDNPELPDELPANWKDGLASRPRPARDRRSEPGKRVTIAQKAPRIRPSRASTGQLNRNGNPHDDDGEDEGDTEAASDNDHDPEDEDQAIVDQLEEENQRAVEVARLSLMEDDNRLAKQQAARWAVGEDDEESEVEEPAQAAAPKPTTSSIVGSIMSKFQNKQVKIVVLNGSKRKGPPGLRKLPGD